MYTWWTGTFKKTSFNAYNSKTTHYMIILMTFNFLENFAYNHSTLVDKNPNYHRFFVFEKLLCSQQKRRISLAKFRYIFIFLKFTTSFIYTMNQWDFQKWPQNFSTPCILGDRALYIVREISSFAILRGS